MSNGGSSFSQSPLATSVEKLRQELDRWIDVAVTQGERALGQMGVCDVTGELSPPVDVVETTDQVVILLDLPGVEPGSVELVLLGNTLRVKGQKPSFTPTGSDQTAHRQERVSGQFSQSITLPVPVNPESVSAEANNGVLRVVLAKSEQAKPTQIPISVKQSPSRSGSTQPSPEDL